MPIILTIELVIKPTMFFAELAIELNYITVSKTVFKG